MSWGAGNATGQPRSTGQRGNGPKAGNAWAARTACQAPNSLGTTPHRHLNAPCQLGIAILCHRTSVARQVTSHETELTTSHTTTSPAPKHLAPYQQGTAYHCHRTQPARGSTPPAVARPLPAIDFLNLQIDNHTLHSYPGVGRQSMTPEMDFRHFKPYLSVSLTLFTPQVTHGKHLETPLIQEASETHPV